MIDHDNGSWGRIVATPRQGGKTTALVEWAREDPENRLILTLNAPEAMRLVLEYGVSAIGPGNVRSDLQKLGPRGQFAVDNAIEVLRNLIGRNPAVVAINDEKAVDESAEVVLLRERDREQKQEIADLRRTIDTLLEMAGLRCGCDYVNGPEQDCPHHGDAVFDPRNPSPQSLGRVLAGLLPQPAPPVPQEEESPF